METRRMHYSAIAAQAKHYEQPMTDFLRDIVAIQSLSGKEDKVIARIRQEVEKLGYADKIWVDGIGNLLVQIGTGPRLIAIDAHVDTVGLGNEKEWKHDPFKGKLEKGCQNEGKVLHPRKTRKSGMGLWYCPKSPIMRMRYIPIMYPPKVKKSACPRLSSPV